MSMYGYSTSKINGYIGEWCPNAEDIYRTLLFAAVKVIHGEKTYYPADYQELATIMTTADTIASVYLYDDIIWYKKVEMKTNQDVTSVMLSSFNLTTPFFAFKDFAHQRFRFNRVKVASSADHLGLVCDHSNDQDTLTYIHRTLVMQHRMVKVKE